MKSEKSLTREQLTHLCNSGYADQYCGIKAGLNHTVLGKLHEHSRSTNNHSIDTGYYSGVRWSNAASDVGGPLVVVGARSNLTRALQSVSMCHVISISEMLQQGIKIEVPENLPFVINAFQPATKLGDISAPTNYIENTLGVLARALEAAVASNCLKLIYTSSAVVYGENPNCREGDPVQIKGVHSALKIASESLVSSFALHHGIDYTIVRPFNLFGGNDHFSVVSKLIRSVQTSSPFKLINEGQALRDFTYVMDAAAVYLEVAYRPSPSIVNIGRGEGVSVRDLVSVLYDRGLEVNLENDSRAEVTKCIANTDILAQFADIRGFLSPLDYINQLEIP